MGHPLRTFLPGTSLHVMRRGNNRAKIFYEDADFLVLLRTLRETAAENSVLVHAFVLMSNHYHLLVTPQRERALPRMMKTLGEQYVKYFNGRYDRIGTLWTGRYKALPIVDERYGLTCLRYIEQNPVRAGMVKTAEEHSWSSYRFHAYGVGCEWITPHPVYLALGPDAKARQIAYRAICEVPLCDDELTEQRHPPRPAKVSEVSDVSDTSGSSGKTKVSDVSDTFLQVS
jgi:REP-associated tyrosine transposase